MDEKLLSAIGFTVGEANVYLYLLQQGVSSAGTLIKKTGLQSSTIYHITDSLIEKGAISSITKNGRKQFIAADPETLATLLEKKRQTIEEQKQVLQRLIPQLKAQNLLAKHPEQETFIFEGWNGVLSAFKDAYTKIVPGTTLYAYTITKEFGGADPKQVRWLINKLREMRAVMNKKTKRKIRMRIIAEKGSSIGEDQAKTSFTEVKFIEKKFINPAVINIYGQVTIIALWLKKPVAFYIVSKEVADSFRNNFLMLWKLVS
ncbi:MAG: helix-turn-helix domain-containing protein [archaeon]